MTKLFLFLTIFVAVFLGLQGYSEELKTFQLVVKNGYFTPSELVVPKNEKFKIEIKNEGTSPEEFESTELNREKVVVAGQTITVFLGPLSAGEYHFFGDFHAETAQGKIVVK